MNITEFNFQMFKGHSVCNFPDVFGKTIYPLKLSDLFF